MGHYYRQSGEPYHYIKRSDGRGTRETNLRDAKKLNLLPSVTEILKILPKPGLDYWKIRQGILSALTLPIKPGESLDGFADRVMIDKEQESKQASSFGKKTHKEIEDYFSGRRKDLDQAKKYAGLTDFISEVRRPLTELTLACTDYGGTIDLIEEKSDMRIIYDWKTQNIKDGEFKFYPEWSYQLKAYSHLVDMNCETEEWEPYRESVLISVAISSTEGRPEWDFKVWNQGERIKAKRVFVAAKELWKELKNYRPEETNK